MAAAGVGGCAPDAFAAAHLLGRPMTLETRCPTTGTPIRVDFRSDGTVAADPATAVVAIIDPRTNPEPFDFTDADRIDADICIHQPLFASPGAAREWLDHHRGGAALPVAEAQDVIKRLIG